MWSNPSYELREPFTSYRLQARAVTNRDCYTLQQEVLSALACNEHLSVTCNLEQSFVCNLQRGL